VVKTNVPALVWELEDFVVDADELEVAVKAATEEPAPEQVAIKADCAALAKFEGHMLEIAD